MEQGLRALQEVGALLRLHGTRWQRSAEGYPPTSSLTQGCSPPEGPCSPEARLVYVPGMGPPLRSSNIGVTLEQFMFQIGMPDYPFTVRNMTFITFMLTGKFRG